MTRDSLRLYLATEERPLHGWLFTGRGVRWSRSHLSESRLLRLLNGWLVRARLDPALYGLHSLRRTFHRKRKPASLLLSSAIGCGC